MIKNVKWNQQKTSFTVVWEYGIQFAASSFEV